MKTTLSLGTIAVIIILSGCQLLEIGQERPSGIAEIAAIVSEYQLQSAYSENTSSDDSLLEDSATTTSFQVSAFEILATNVTIERVLDDNGTPNDPTDDEMTITRTWTAWNELAHKEVLVRPLKPTSAAAWAGEWDANGQIEQTGTLAHYVSDMSTPFATVTLTATWQIDTGTVYLSFLERVGDRIGRDGVLNKVFVTVDANGQRTKEVIRYRLTGGNEVVVSRLVYEEWIDPDTQEVFTKVTRYVGDSSESDGYAIIRSHVDPRIVEFYSNEDLLLKRRTETRNTADRTTDVEVIFYDADGNVVNTVNGSIKVRADGDSVIVTKEFDNGRERTVTITDNGDGFTVDRNGRTYTVTFLDDGSILVETEDGTFTVTINADGSWTVEAPDGATEVVAV